jgi:flagellar hook-length control protein FliK
MARPLLESKETIPSESACVTSSLPLPTMSGPRQTFPAPSQRNEPARSAAVFALPETQSASEPVRAGFGAERQTASRPEAPRRETPRTEAQRHEPAPAATTPRDPDRSGPSERSIEARDRAPGLNRDDRPDPRPPEHRQTGGTRRREAEPEAAQTKPASDDKPVQAGSDTAGVAATPEEADGECSNQTAAETTSALESILVPAEPGTPAAPVAMTALAMMQVQAGTPLPDDAGGGTEGGGALAAVPATGAATTGVAADEAEAAAQVALAAHQGISGDETGVETGEAGNTAGTASPAGAVRQGSASHGAAMSALATALAGDGTGAAPGQGQPGAMSQAGRTISAEAKQQDLQGSEAARPDLKAGNVPAVDGGKAERADSGAGQAAAEASELPGPSLPQTGAAHAPARANETLPPVVPEMPRAVAPGAVPVEIGLRALQGLKEFQIRLDPAELGRVEVKLEIGEDNLVTAKVVVDRVETLHLLQRDARTLERAFEQAGLKSSDGGIDFSLRDQGQGARQERSEQDRDRSGETGGTVRAELPELTPLPLRRTLHVGALDLSI